MLRLHIDHDLCSGNGRCYAMFPELFTDDDSGYGQTLDGGDVADAELARKAVLCCPEKAISIEEIDKAGE